jgi:4-amino-4-deoxy-L-arabinose transferase-like glycosyltransferase
MVRSNVIDTDLDSLQDGTVLHEDGYDDRRSVLVSAGLALFLLWLAPLTSSLWTDETATAWVLQPGFSETWHRAVTYQPLPPLFFTVDWLFTMLLGRHEWAMRLPSLLAMVGAVLLTWRLGRRLFGETAGVLGAIVLGVSGTGAFLATDARPYGLALFLFIASTFFLVRWTSEGGPLDGIAFVVTGALMWYAAFIFAPAVLAQVAYSARKQTAGTAVSTRALILAWVATAAVVLPLTPFVLHVAAGRSDVSLPVLPTPANALIAVMPTILAAGALLGLLLARIEGRFGFHLAQSEPGGFLLVSVWLVAPPLVLLVASQLSGDSLWAERHLAILAPAWSLLAGWALAGIDRASARRIVLIAMVIASVLGVGTLVHTNDDGIVENWRGAIDFARANLNPTTTVLMDPNLVESADPAWLRDPVKSSYLMAPFAMYPLDSAQAPVAVPALPVLGTSGYFKDVLARVSSGGQVILISRSATTIAWINGQLAKDGYSVHGRGFGDVAVVIYTPG